MRQHTLRAFFIVRDRRTPWRVRLIALAAVAYAISPLDLVIDFVPLIGVLDDAVIIALGFWLLERLSPPEVLVEAGVQAEGWLRRPKAWLLGGLLAIFWLVVGVLLLRTVWNWLFS